MNDLLEAKLIAIDKDDCICPLAEAHIMSKTLIKFNSMRILMQLPASNTLQQVLCVCIYVTVLLTPISGFK
ncbi:hypothetical protein EON65_40880 [archaeon]|nr:MAG: hypothetical protein EON65_40880 [archaeon]